MRHTSFVVVCGRTGKVRVCKLPLYSSGIITRKTDELAGSDDDRHCDYKNKKIISFI